MERARMKVLSVVGARPQFVKLAPICLAMSDKAEIEHVIVHTGQHYDANMSDVFFEGLSIPRPDVNLGVGSGTHGVQTGEMLAKMDGVLAEHRPDMVLVYGDTNSTLAGTLSAVKLQIPVAHLEAGLRSFNRTMPEEHNRILTDHAADLLLAPTQVAVDHLNREGLGSRTVLVGDVMADVCLRTRDLMEGRPGNHPSTLKHGSPYLVATIHRAENTDDPDRLGAIIRALQEIEKPVMLLSHPRLVEKARAFDLELVGGQLVVGNPLAYHELIAAVMHSEGVITDSGGLQKEAYLLGKVCTTVRAETEWVETLDDGWNVLTADPAAINTFASRSAPAETRHCLYGDGHAASVVVNRLVAFHRG